MFCDIKGKIITLCLSKKAEWGWGELNRGFIYLFWGGRKDGK